MKSFKTFLLLAATTFAAFSCSAEKNISVKEQLAKAREDNNTVLMVVTDKSTSTEKMNGLVKEAVKGMENISILQMSMDDEKNADLVKEYKLSGAPMPVLLLFSNKGLMLGGMTRELCESAKKEIAGKVEVVIVDTEDAKEEKLIEMLNIKNKLEDTFIVAINGQGMMSGRFDTIPTQTDLIAAATKVVQTGYAPGGCGPTCK